MFRPLRYLRAWYIYESDPSSTAPKLPVQEEVKAEGLTADLALMPPEWVAQLHQAALYGGELILSLIAKIPATAVAFANGLTEFVKEYQFHKITHLTGKFAHE